MVLRLRVILGLALIGFCSVAKAAAQERKANEQFDLVELVEDTTDSMTDLQDHDDIELWPWNKKNKTHEDSSCSTHTTCQECSSRSSFCHWCGADNACHAKGSVHGCFEGVTCVEPNKENSTCASHTHCSDCDLSSSLCHWCAHDNACHAVGSVYGCMSAVNCYSNDRCQRYESEEITGFFIEDVGMLPLFIIFAVSLTICCCASLCFCSASGFKGAYDDIVVVAAGGIDTDPYGEGLGGGGTTTGYSRPPSAILTPTIQENENEDAEEDEEEGQTGAGAVSADQHDEGLHTDITEEAALLESHLDRYHQDDHDGYSLMSNAVSAAPSAYATVAARGGTNSMQHIFNICRICYVVTLIGIVGFAVGSIRYFPKVPTYNVCNDNLAWKSIVDNMTSLKAEATVEILVSVLNPNHFSAAVDMGRGTFNHNGVFVGTFDIPPTVVPAMSIIDIRVVAHFTPAKWEALSLSAEYYKGTLAFDIDAMATFRFPWLFDYSSAAKFNDIHVLVNDPKLLDRHLCACPKWSDFKNKTEAIM
jgi:hypothetical protein